MLLVDVAQFDGFAHFKLAAIGLFESHDEAEERGLAGAVGSNHTDNAVGGQHEVEVGEKHFVAEGFLHVLRFDDLIAQTRSVGNVDFEVLLLFLLVFVEQAVVAVEAGFSLGLAGFWSHPYPFQLAFEGLATLRGHLFFLFHALGLLFEP